MRNCQSEGEKQELEGRAKEKWQEEAVLLLQVGERRSSSAAGVPAGEPKEPEARSSALRIPTDWRSTALSGDSRHQVKGLAGSRSSCEERRQCGFW